MDAERSESRMMVAAFAVLCLLALGFVFWMLAEVAQWRDGAVARTVGLAAATRQHELLIDSLDALEQVVYSSGSQGLTELRRAHARMENNLEMLVGDDHAPSPLLRQIDDQGLIELYRNRGTGLAWQTRGYLGRLAQIMASAPIDRAMATEALVRGRDELDPLWTRARVLHLEHKTSAERNALTRLYGSLALGALLALAMMALGVWSLITSKRRTPDKTELQRDPATDLPDERAFRAFLNEVAPSVERPHRTQVLVYFEIERLGLLNAAIGHERTNGVLRAFCRSVDQALKALGHGAARDQGNAPCEYFLARLKGCRFGIWIDDSDNYIHTRDAVAAIRDIAAARSFMPRDALEIELDIKVGLAAKENNQKSLHDWDQAARQALKAASGSLLRDLSNVVPFTRELALTNARSRTLQIDLLRDGIEGAVHLVYQPIMSLKTGDIAGCEALLRWTHPLLGAVPPRETLDAALATGVLPELTRHLISAALTDLASFTLPPNGFHAPLSLNLNRFQIDALDPEDILEGCRDKDIDPARLVLELSCIDASEPMPFRMIEKLQILGDAGIRFALDDVGRGILTLRDFAAIPFSMLKIDPDLLSAGAENGGSERVLDAILRFADSYGLVVAAEGVETAADMRFAIDHGIEWAQGYHFCKPLSAPDFFLYAQQTDRRNVELRQTRAPKRPKAV